MVDALNESTSAGYARRDTSVDRLWQSNRSQVSSNGGRTTPEKGDDSEQTDEGAQAKPAAIKMPMIGQEDTLKLESAEEHEPPNPFEKLIAYQLQRDVGAASTPRG